MEKEQMKIFKSGSVATLVAICFFFVSFATQPAEAMSHKSKSGAKTNKTASMSDPAAQ